eukprot:6195379-Pleurochrysis_carterae.AAC.1
MTADEDVPIADKHWLQLESSAYTAETRLTRLQARRAPSKRLRWASLSPLAWSTAPESLHL